MLHGALEPISVPLREKLFDFDEQQLAVYEKTGETETFRFINWEDFSGESVTLPIDKIVADYGEDAGSRKVNQQLVTLKDHLRFVIIHCRALHLPRLIFTEIFFYPVMYQVYDWSQSNRHHKLINIITHADGHDQTE